MMDIAIFLIGSCAGSLAIWASTSYPANRFEKVINRISGSYTIASFLILIYIVS